MHTADSLKQDLSRMKISPENILLIHISYKAIGEVDGRADAVLDALSGYMHNGLLLLPAHTWANIKQDENPVMDVRSTPVCVGALPELFRNRPNVCRSLHPTHSLCGLGQAARQFLYGDHLAQTPCGQKTAYRRLYEHNAQILLVGVGFNRNTFIHCVEEMYSVPGRLSEEQHKLWVIDYDGTKYFTPQYRHCYPELSALFSWENEMVSAGAVTRERFGDADCFLCDARKLANEMGKLL
jgi:aminoglycoside 3-N-acetyltransferase